ncbi:hypothetical protein CEXT_146621 [Caerostris extrusa]|uniref:Uncharacterized protein n=1 Tax=Caerostris extrusa TaxID=172846 RepID=A0AAV4P145_CAEEX|nr:hypothetical protein CEXT_146621 [Caerostris extrusa]
MHTDEKPNALSIAFVNLLRNGFLCAQQNITFGKGGLLFRVIELGIAQEEIDPGGKAFQGMALLEEGISEKAASALKGRGAYFCFLSLFQMCSVLNRYLRYFPESCIS